MMVRHQLMARGIRDPAVLDAMRKVLRHEFVPEAAREESYRDCAVPIWHGATISQPLMVAVMLELLEIRGGEKTLEVGTGSGYQACVLAEMGADVVSIERIPELAEVARQNCERAGYYVEIVVGDGSLGWPDEAPYDRIVFTASPPEVPPALEEQLAPGGKMVGPVGSRDFQQLVLVEKDEEGELTRHRHGGCLFLPLIGEQGWPKPAKKRRRKRKREQPEDRA
jgi:protein-L-isoaspartate(D-aspartate) O-methyltransferase